MSSVVHMRTHGMMANRYVYNSKEGIEDCMRWVRCTEEEIKERLIN